MLDPVRVRAAEAEDMQRRAAAALRAGGLRPGDRAAVISPSSPAMFATIVGALRVGIVPVVLNAGLLERELEELITDADPQIVLRPHDLSSLVEHDGRTELAAVPLARPMHYTSGTTGRPKGVWSGVLDEGAAEALVAEERELWGFAADDVHLVCSPLYHSAPLRFATGTVLAGGDLLILPRFDARAVNAALARGDATSMFCVPTHLQRMFAAGTPDVRSMRLLLHAGAPCPAPLKLQTIEAFPRGSVWEFYGSTEGQFTACTSDEWLDRPGTVGRARPGRTLEVDDAGVIWCHVPAHARFEYWRAPDKTAAAWRDDAFTVGDVGRLDDDGYLFIDGRREDLIITGGVNVYPAEVEQAIVQMPGVTMAAVFGVDDDRWGQRVCAAVVGDVRPEDVLAHCRGLLAPFKCPKDVYMTDELPTTGTGKVMRLRLAEHLSLDS